jgi:hypothetical protein
MNAMDDGTMVSTIGKKLDRVLKLDLSLVRDKEYYNIPCKEITIAQLDTPINLYLDDPVPEKAMTIKGPIGIEAKIDCFFISNNGAGGLAEIWLWR